MTKIFKSLFLGGILLSSVSGYSSQLSIVSGSGIPTSSTDAISIDGATVKVQESLELNTNITVGDLRDGLAYSTAKISITKPGDETAKEYSAGDVIVANGFKYASYQDGVWKELYVESPSQIVPISDTTYKYGTDGNTYKIYSVDDEEYINPLFESNDSGETWTVSGNTETVKVIDIDGTPYSLSEANVLYSGNVAVKDSGVWKLLPGFSPDLSKAILTVNDSITLTLGNQQEQVQDESGNPVYEEDGSTPKMVNKEASTLTVTELGEVHGSVDLQNTKIDGTTATYANKAVFKKGSSAGTKAKPAEFTKGVIDLSDHVTYDSYYNFVGTANANLYLTITDSNVNVFNNLRTMNAEAKNTFIDSFNESRSAVLFSNVTGNFIINDMLFIIKVASEGGSSTFLESPYFTKTTLEGINNSATISINAISPDKAQTVLFSNNCTITTKSNDYSPQDALTNLLKSISTNNPEAENGGSVTLTVDGPSFSKLDSNIEYDNLTQYEYNGTDKKFKIVLNKSSEESQESGGNDNQQTGENPQEEQKQEEKELNVDAGTTEIQEPEASSGDGVVTVMKVASVGSTELPVVYIPNTNNSAQQINQVFNDSVINYKASSDPKNPTVAQNINIQGESTVNIEGNVNIEKQLEITGGSNVAMNGNVTVGKLAMTGSSKCTVLGGLTIGKSSS